MTPMNEVTPKRLTSEQLIVEQLADELMVYDRGRNRAFSLNQKAALVWQQCDGTATPQTIAERLTQTLNEPVDENMVQFALASLSNDGLLETSTVAAPAMTRRSLMQKFGVTAAMSLPIVTSLLVATPKAHASAGGGRKSPPPPPPPPPPLPPRRGGR